MTTKWNDYGESSLTLLAVHCGIEKEDIATPQDPSDFRRCIHLFECMGFNENNILDLLILTSSKYPKWKPFLENWNKLIKLYSKEKNYEKAEKLYELLKQLNKG